MRRVLRWAFNATAAVSSAVLFVATCVLWARSYRTMDVLQFQRQSGRWEVLSRRGRLSTDNVPQRRLEREPLNAANNSCRAVEASGRRFG
jgi:hypothetical protein